MLYWYYAQTYNQIQAKVYSLSVTSNYLLNTAYGLCNLSITEGHFPKNWAHALLFR